MNKLHYVLETTQLNYIRVASSAVLCVPAGGQRSCRYQYWNVCTTNKRTKPDTCKILCLSCDSLLIVSIMIFILNYLHSLLQLDSAYCLSGKPGKVRDLKSGHEKEGIS
jgi:hypothetical protein